jgi:hypothetical protein
MILLLSSQISELICKCRSEQDINKKIETLYYINSILQKSKQLNIPSLLTDDYVNTALYSIQEIPLL